MSFFDFDRPFVYDLTALKDIESFGSTLTLLRIGVTGGISTLIWLVFEEAPIAQYFVLYGLLTLSQTLLVSLFPKVVGRLGAVILFLSCLLIGLSWVLGLAHLWMTQVFAMRMLALCGLFWWMIYAVTARNNDPVMMSATTTGIVVALVLLPLLSWWELAEGQEALLLVVTNAFGFSYFLQGLYDVRRTRLALQQAQRNAAETARIEALGRLTGGVAHDFNNLLTVISGNLELVREIDDPVEQAILLRDAGDAANRAAQVTGQLLTYSRRATLRPSLTFLVDLIAPLNGLLKRLLPAGTTVVLEVGADLPPLMVDRSRFETVLLNLCLNARDAIQPDGGTIVVMAQVRKIGAPMAGRAEHGTPTPGTYLQIRVCDTGTGMSPEVLERVCEPYFTTKALGQGSGLGLSMAKGFAEQSGGTLLFDSVQGKGTCVALTLPVAAGPEVEPQIAKAISVGA